MSLNKDSDIKTWKDSAPYNRVDFIFGPSSNSRTFCTITEMQGAIFESYISSE